MPCCRVAPAASFEVAFDAATFDIKVKVVCESCNNGWMARLEDAVKPALAAIIELTPTELDRDRQQVVAAWLTKTGMMAEFIAPHRVLASQASRRHMHDLGVPTKGTSVWIAPRLAQVPVGRFRCHKAHRRIGAGILLEPAYEMVFALGGFISRVVELDPAVPAIKDMPPPFVRIWPPSQEIVALDPKDGLDASAVDAWFREGMNI